MTIRVPAGKFDATLAQIEKLGKVDSGQVGREDVTRQYVDLQTRLKVAQDETRAPQRPDETRRSAGRHHPGREQALAGPGARREPAGRAALSQAAGRASHTITVTLYEPRPAQVGSPGPFHLYYYAKGAVFTLAKVLRGLLVLVMYVVVVGWIVWLPLLIWWRVRKARRRPPPPG